MKFSTISGKELMRQIINGKRDFSWTKLVSDKHISYPEKDGNVNDLYLEMQQYLKRSTKDLQKSPIKAHHADWSGLFVQQLRLHYADFTYANLASAQFLDCDLRFSNFGSANLSKAKIIPNEPRMAQTHSVDLRNSSFEGAQMCGTSLAGLFKNANFRTANLRSAVLFNINLKGSTFEQANLSDAVIGNLQSEFEKAHHRLRELNNMRGCNLKLTNCENTRFAYTDLTGSVFKGAKLKKARFYNCVLNHISKEDTNLDDAIIAGTNKE